MRAFFFLCLLQLPQIVFLSFWEIIPWSIVIRKVVTRLTSDFSLSLLIDAWYLISVFSLWLVNCSLIIDPWPLFAKYYRIVKLSRDASLLYGNVSSVIPQYLCHTVPQSLRLTSLFFFLISWSVILSGPPSSAPVFFLLLTFFLSSSSVSFAKEDFLLPYFLRLNSAQTIPVAEATFRDSIVSFFDGRKAGMVILRVI